MQTEQSSPRIIVGFASAGRPEILAAAVQALAQQTLMPSRIVISVPSGSDLANIGWHPSSISIVKGLRGLTLQRNAIIRSALADAGPDDLLVFFDDDFFPEPHYLEAAARLFAKHTDLVMATGALIADGIIGPGLQLDYAKEMLEREPAPDLGAPMKIRDVYNAYGCNMVVSIATLRATGAQFDERLPLYGWLEDVDFSRAIATSGRIVQVQAMRGVHLGVKSGRQSGERLGYSQIANPVYLMSKHRCARSKALKLMARNVTANLLKSPRPEPFIDRSGRLAGNMRALGDLFTGRLKPERAAQL